MFSNLNICGSIECFLVLPYKPSESSRGLYTYNIKLGMKQFFSSFLETDPAQPGLLY